MILHFATKKLEKLCTNSRQMQAGVGMEVAKTLMRRIQELTVVTEMEDLRAGPGRWEELGQGSGQRD
jgi:plasmid maintenance system killer protein